VTRCFAAVSRRQCRGPEVTVDDTVKGGSIQERCRGPVVTVGDTLTGGGVQEAL
jgi:hypothetical protein